MRAALEFQLVYALLVGAVAVKPHVDIAILLPG
jgi:hypothetical protein